MNSNAITSNNYTENGELISLSGIKLSLQGTLILQGVDLHMKKGEIYGMLGPNGAGKSTTISIIAALRRPDAGTALVLRIDPANQPVEVRRRIGVLAENAGFYDWMTGSEYLLWFAGFYAGNIQGDKVHALLARVGLDGNSQVTIGRYSRGMKQRLGLARALVNNPELLILDEPTSGLDPGGRRDIHDLLLDLNRNHNIGILLSTHLLDDVERLCGRVGIIHRGRTVLEGETEKLCLGETGIESYLLRVREPFPDINGPLPNGICVVKSGDDLFRVEVAKGIPVDSIWRILMASGWNIIEVQREDRSLEEIYLAAVKKGERDESLNAHRH